MTSLNTQLFKNIAYVGSFGHILFNLIFNVNSNLAESSANCSDEKSIVYADSTGADSSGADNTVSKALFMHSFPRSVPKN